MLTAVIGVDSDLKSIERKFNAKYELTDQRFNKMLGPRGSSREALVVVRHSYGSVITPKRVGWKFNGRTEIPFTRIETFLKGLSEFEFVFALEHSSHILPATFVEVITTDSKKRYEWKSVAALACYSKAFVERKGGCQTGIAVLLNRKNKPVALNERQIDVWLSRDPHVSKKVELLKELMRLNI